MTVSYLRELYSQLRCQPTMTACGALGAPLMGCSYVSTLRLIFQPIMRHDSKLFMDSGVMVQLKGNYSLIVSHSSELLQYTVFTGLQYCF